MKGTKELNAKNSKEKTRNVGARLHLCSTNRGITLIALIITIIVMLILVAVTITAAVNGGLFEYAAKAGRETNESILAEQNLAEGKVEIEGKIYNSIDEYVNGDTSKGEMISFTIDGEKFTTKRGNTWIDFVPTCDLDLFMASSDDREFGIVDWSTFQGNALPLRLYKLCLDGNPVKRADEIIEEGAYLAVNSGVISSTYSGSSLKSFIELNPGLNF